MRYNVITSWHVFLENKLNSKLCIIMRGLPGSGKSTTTQQLMTKYAVTYNHVFSTDDQFQKTSNLIRDLGHISLETISLEKMIEYCQQIIKMWYSAKWSPTKEDAKNQFIEFKKLFEQGNYLEALQFFQNSHHLFSSVEYLGNWSGERLGYAHKTNLENFKKAVDSGVSPVIVDNCNTSVKDAAPYAQYAHEAGYEIKIQEPTSPHWDAHKKLFSDKYLNKDKLSDFARFLADKNTHKVPYDTLEKMINRWVPDMKPEHLLEKKPNV